LPADRAAEKKQAIIPANRVNYLRDIAETVQNYNKRAQESVEKLRNYESLKAASSLISDSKEIKEKITSLEAELETELQEVKVYDSVIDQYLNGEFTYVVRGKDIKVPTKHISLSGSKISKVGFPRFHYASDKLKFIRAQNLPGFYPYAAGVFPFKRADEDPKRQFAGEGGPLRTNARFHYLSKNDTAK